MSNILILNIFLHQEKIGFMTLLPNDKSFFSFDEKYISHQDRATLSLSFKNKQGDLITTTPLSRMHLPPFFSNLLPEGPLRHYLAQRSKVHEKREFFILEALGQDLPGAITASFSEDYRHENHDKISPLNSHTSLISPLKFSLAGVQLKFSALMGPQGGLTIPAEGTGGSWIVKLPSTHFKHVPENEFSMMTLARLIGIDIPQVHLIPMKNIQGLPEEIGNASSDALAVKRFDRQANGEKIHMEDFAQVFSIYPEEKYEKASYKNIAQVLMTHAGLEDTVEFVRRLIFNTLIGNADMHLKNWSLIYPDKVNPRLSPGYDFVSTIPYLQESTMALKYVHSKNMYDLSFDRLSYFAAKAFLPERLILKTAKETVQKFKDAWEKEISHLPIMKKDIDIISHHMKKIKLFYEV